MLMPGIRRPRGSSGGRCGGSDPVSGVGRPCPTAAAAGRQGGGIGEGETANRGDRWVGPSNSPGNDSARSAGSQTRSLDEETAGFGGCTLTLRGPMVRDVSLLRMVANLRMLANLEEQTAAGAACRYMRASSISCWVCITCRKASSSGIHATRNTASHGGIVTLPEVVDPRIRRL